MSNLNGPISEEELMSKEELQELENQQEYLDKNAHWDARPKLNGKRNYSDWKLNTRKYSDEYDMAYSQFLSNDKLTKELRKKDYVEILNEEFLDFDIPNWGVANYINERTNWQKSLYTIAGERGWFYFKLFFKFKTNYGLFGGIMTDETSSLASINSASRYLYMIRNNYKTLNIKHRLLALYKFTALLSTINSESPWYFKGINNLNQAYNAYGRGEQKDQFIEIDCMEESTDMRLNMLMDLYKYICFDNIGCHEIIPENLRKFDMSVLIFHIPIKYYQTAIMATGKEVNIPGNDKMVDKINSKLNFLNQSAAKYYKYKSFSGNDGNMSNAMSFQMFTFQNCEFDTESFGDYYQSLSNENPNDLGKNKIKIKFDKCYKHIMNEWNEFMLGPDGFHYNQTTPEDMPIIDDAKNNTLFIAKDPNSNIYLNRLVSISKGMQARFFNPSNDNLQYKGLIDFTEYAITDCLINSTMQDVYSDTKGNLYGDVGIGSEYFKNKMKWLKQGMISGNLYDNTKPLTRNAQAQLETDIHRYIGKTTNEWERLKKGITDFFKW